MAQVPLPAAMQAFLSNQPESSVGPPENCDYDEEFEYEQCSDSEGDLDMEVFDDDGGCLVTEQGESLVPFDPEQ
eukprot:11130041-Karenia_brevis.AAC.1